MKKIGFEIPVNKSELVKIKDIKIDGDNPNKMNEEKLRALNEIMEEVGYLNPVVITKDMILIDGEHRIKAYKQYGKKEIPAFVLDVENDSDRRMLRQRLNKVKGTHDELLDAEEFKRIIEGGYDTDYIAELLGDEESEIKRILRLLQADKQEDFDINKAFDKVKEPTVKLGEVWQLGSHRLMCGDSTDSGHVRTLMDGEEANMVFTDPPYGLGGYAGRSGKFNGIKGDDEEVIKFYEAIPKVKERYIWGNYQVLMQLKEVPRDVICWVKNNFGMGKGYRNQYEMCFYYGDFAGSDSDVWHVNKDTIYLHPTQKPIELALHAIENSCDIDGIVLDLYGGSGTTLIACEKTSRKCFMMELDPKYCDVIIKRWEEFTNKKAVKIS